MLLILIFGGLVAAATPLLIGGLAILGAFVAVRLLTMVTDVSVFAINVITLIGLGMAIDYSLFIVSRFREELAAGRRDRRRRSRAPMATAGRTVLVSGLTIALALASLLIFPQMFLRSMGFGGMAAVLVAMLAALTVLPALLAVLGHRINALRGAAAVAPRPAERPATARGRGIARSVMRRPVLYAVGVIAVLLAPGRRRSCGCSSAASTSGCCRPAPSRGSCPSGSAPTSRAAASGRSRCWSPAAAAPRRSSARRRVGAPARRDRRPGHRARAATRR